MRCIFDSALEALRSDRTQQGNDEAKPEEGDLTLAERLPVVWAQHAEVGGLHVGVGCLEGKTQLNSHIA